jgi:hypothetical protein
MCPSRVHVTEFAVCIVAKFLLEASEVIFRSLSQTFIVNANFAIIKRKLTFSKLFQQLCGNHGSKFVQG